ncbi:MAG TPA: hypothetical protein H9759_04790 [Candidatus Dietzia intestinipullorum]|nr:hypothetical protein [Candidatus Dietzia merdigallinarum]HJC28694.1 hypothetical protein [Candidatus Dietzia intestinipullorum]
MQEIACQQCGTTVLAEKYSERHVSVQWLTAATESCPRIRLAEAADGDTSVEKQVGTLCPALYETIDQAARDGVVPFSLRNEPTPGVLR